MKRNVDNYDKCHGAEDANQCINNRDPEDTVTKEIMIVAWVTGSILISKTNFTLEDGAERNSSKSEWGGRRQDGVGGGLVARGRECRNNQPRDNLPNSSKGS